MYIYIICIYVYIFLTQLVGKRCWLIMDDIVRKVTCQTIDNKKYNWLPPNVDSAQHALFVFFCVCLWVTRNSNAHKPSACVCYSVFVRFSSELMWTLAQLRHHTSGLHKKDGVRTFRRMPYRRMPFCRIPFRQMPTRRILFCPMPIRQIPIRWMPIRRMPFRRMAFSQIPINGMSIREMPIRQIRFTECRLAKCRFSKCKFVKCCLTECCFAACRFVDYRCVGNL